MNWQVNHVTQPEYQVRFRWQKVSVEMWDNRCTQHYAVAGYLPAYRCMNRVAVVKGRQTNT